MKKRIVCYGDSNTYGYDAADWFGGRLPAEQRWGDLLARPDPFFDDLAFTSLPHRR